VPTAPDDPAARPSSRPADDDRPRPGPTAAPPEDDTLPPADIVADTAPSPTEGLAGSGSDPRRSTSRYTAADDRPQWRTEPRTRVPARSRRLGGLPALRQPPPPTEIVTTTTGAIVGAAKVGRLLGRTGLRLARQLPGVGTVEAQAQRLGQVAAAQLLKTLDIPQQLVGTATPEERRVMMLVHDAGTDAEPLRSAMTELLQRSSASDSTQGREYLFGTIISQLVPDEARILATLATGRRFAVVDVLAKQVGRSQTRSVLTNVSSVGPAAHVALPENVPTYLSRLHGFGLVEFSPTLDDLESQFVTLLDEPVVRAARAEADGKFGTAKVTRKSVTLSVLGQEFWAACAPDATAIDRLSG
jgi:hypothetical protein